MTTVRGLCSAASANSSCHSWLGGPRQSAHRTCPDPHPGSSGQSRHSDRVPGPALGPLSAPLSAAAVLSPDALAVKASCMRGGSDQSSEGLEGLKQQGSVRLAGGLQPCARPYLLLWRPRPASATFKTCRVNAVGDGGLQRDEGGGWDAVHMWHMPAWRQVNCRSLPLLSQLPHSIPRGSQGSTPCHILQKCSCQSSSAQRWHVVCHTPCLLPLHPLSGSEALRQGRKDARTESLPVKYALHIFNR